MKFNTKTALQSTNILKRISCMFSGLRSSTELKTLLYAMLFISVISCGESRDERNYRLYQQGMEKSVNVNGYELAVMVFDSCEYVVSGQHYSQMITHKGNCKFCKTRNK